MQRMRPTGYLLRKLVQSNKINARSAVDIMLVIDGAHLKRGRLAAGPQHFSIHIAAAQLGVPFL